jgi:phospholipid transport system substrate-binding protein
MTTLSRRAVVAAIALAPILAGPPARAEGEASAFIRKFGDETLVLLVNQPGTDAERAERLRELLDAGFDMRSIGRAALGPSWRHADDGQREAYLQAFVDFIVATYAIRIRDYSGETFEVVGEKPIGENDTLVSTLVRRVNKEPIKVDYRVRAKDGGFRIIDVIVEGLSMLTSQRQEFAAVVQREGVDGLITQLQNRAKELLPAL